LNKVVPEENDVLVSFDVQAMFPNIPMNETYKIIRENWNLVEPHTTIKDINLFMDGLKLCNKQYLLYNGNFIRQLDGIAMGGSLSVNLSGIYMNKVIDLAIINSKIKPKILLKYVDDVLCMMKENDIAPFLNALNSIHPNIIFTEERER